MSIYTRVSKDFTLRNTIAQQLFNSLYASRIRITYSVEDTASGLGIIGMIWKKIPLTVPPRTLWDMGVLENRGPQESTLNSRIKVPLIFGNPKPL